MANDRNGAIEPLGDRPAGLLLVGHGTREAEGLHQFHQLAQRISAESSDWDVATAFLELAQPTVLEGLEGLLRRGHRQVVVAPLLLFAAGHAKRDLPALLETARQKWPGVEICQAGHLGCLAEMVELSAQRLRAALASDSLAPPPEDTLLVMIGRGSHDPEANAEMAQFARLCFERSGLAWCELGFTAMARPGLERSLEVAAALPFRHVVVQPHLLFDGLLLTRIREACRGAALAHPAKTWQVTAPLGVDPLLMAAVMKRANQTLGPVVGPAPASFADR